MPKLTEILKRKPAKVEVTPDITMDRTQLNRRVKSVLARPTRRALNVPELSREDYLDAGYEEKIPEREAEPHTDENMWQEDRSLDETVTSGNDEDNGIDTPLSPREEAQAESAQEAEEFSASGEEDATREQTHSAQTAQPETAATEDDSLDALRARIKERLNELRQDSDQIAETTGTQDIDVEETDNTTPEMAALNVEASDATTPHISTAAAENEQNLASGRTYLEETPSISPLIDELAPENSQNEEESHDAFLAPQTSDDAFSDSQEIPVVMQEATPAVAEERQEAENSHTNSKAPDELQPTANLEVQSDPGLVETEEYLPEEQMEDRQDSEEQLQAGEVDAAQSDNISDDMDRVHAQNAGIMQQTPETHGDDTLDELENDQVENAPEEILRDHSDETRADAELSTESIGQSLKTAPEPLDKILLPQALLSEGREVEAAEMVVSVAEYLMFEAGYYPEELPRQAVNLWCMNFLMKHVAEDGLGGFVYNAWGQPEIWSACSEGLKSCKAKAHFDALESLGELMARNADLATALGEDPRAGDTHEEFMAIQTELQEAETASPLANLAGTWIVSSGNLEVVPDDVFETRITEIGQAPGLEGRKAA